MAAQRSFVKDDFHHKQLMGPHDLWLQDVPSVFDEQASCSPQT